MAKASTLPAVSASGRPRTRSAVGKSGIPVKTPLASRKRRKTAAGNAPRHTKSPVIDLTSDHDDLRKVHEESESPLKHARKRVGRASKTRALRNAVQLSPPPPELNSSPIKTTGGGNMHKQATRSEAHSGSAFDAARNSKDETDQDSGKRKEKIESSEKIESLDSEDADLVVLGSPTKPYPKHSGSEDLGSVRAGFSNGLSENGRFPNMPDSPEREERAQKKVAFSDNILSSSPRKRHDEMETPRKSILKNIHPMPSPAGNPSPSHEWVQTLHTGTALEFWQPGTIVQLEPKSPELPRLVAKSLQALKSGNFERKFEVYASLNLIFKHNVVSTIHDIFARQVPTPAPDADCDLWTSGSPETVPRALLFFAYARRDVQLLEARLFGKSLKQEGPESDRKTDESLHTESSEAINVKDSPRGTSTMARQANSNQESKLDAEHAAINGVTDKSGTSFDPFEARTLNQALKFMAHFLAIPSLSSLVPATVIRWCYLHSCELLARPALSKSLVSSYICIIKDFNFSSRQKRAIFDTSVPEHVLSTLLNMQSFLSSSLINEKFIAMRNLISHFPACMAKTFHHWFRGLIMNLCDLSFVLYYKVVGTGIATLLEAARNFLDSNDVCHVTRAFLENPVLAEQSWVTESTVDVGSFGGQTTLSFVVDTLRRLCLDGQYKYAMDIWVGVSLLLGKLDSWPHLSAWLSVHKTCFNEKPLAAKETAVSSWKVVVFRMCQEIAAEAARENDVASPKKSAFDDFIRPKAKLLVHPFTCITTPSDGLVVALHNCFLSLLYMLLNSQAKFGVRVMQALWDRVIQPVLVDFYFRKQASSRMQELGLEVVARLLKPSPPANENHFNSLRCLWNESIPLVEINCLSPKWVFLRFDKVLRVLSAILASRSLSTDARMTGLMAFLNSVKSVTKKEVSASDNTYDIIDALPPCLETFLQASEVGYEDVFKILVILNDTFGASNLVSEDRNVYLTILGHCAGQWTPQQLNAILSMIFGAVGERKSFRFFSILERVEKKVNRPDILAFLSDTLNQKKYVKFGTAELVVLGRLFTRLDCNFSAIAKKVIQHIVLLKAEDFDEMVVRLNVASWHLQIFSFFVVLMHNAPYDHLNRATVSLIRKRGDFPEIVRLLVEHEFDAEILAVKDLLGGLEGHEAGSVLSAYLKRHPDLAFVDQILSAFSSETDVEEIVGGRWESFPISASKKASVEITDSLESMSEETVDRKRSAESPLGSNKRQAASMSDGLNRSQEASSLEITNLEKQDSRKQNRENEQPENQDLDHQNGEGHVLANQNQRSENQLECSDSVKQVSDSESFRNPNSYPMDESLLQVIVKDQSTANNTLSFEARSVQQYGKDMAAFRHAAKLRQLMAELSSEDLAQMSKTEKYALETDLLQLMVRMRQ